MWISDPPASSPFKWKLFQDCLATIRHELSEVEWEEAVMAINKMGQDEVISIAWAEIKALSQQGINTDSALCGLKRTEFLR
jgi:hypothetical protein